jgi:8-oxo-dGTP diphosphatase
MKTRVFTTGVVIKRGRLLILKRRPDDDTYPGVWDCVGGHFEPGESAEDCILREAREEAGQEMKIVKVGPLIEYLDQYGRAVAVPFVLRPDPNRPVVVSEHSEYRWVRPGDLRRYEVVPDLSKALALFGMARGERASGRLREEASRPRS